MMSSEFRSKYRYVLQCERCRLFADVWFRFIGTGTFGKGATFADACPLCGGGCVTPGGSYDFVGNEATKKFSFITLLEAIEFQDAIEAFQSQGVPASAIQRLIHGYAPDYETRLKAIHKSEILLKAVVTPIGKGTEGQIVRAIGIPWLEIIALLEKDPSFAYQIDWRRWEEIIAASYDKAGFDEVILTPRSNDGGRDVIATKNGIGSIRFFDQVKAYAPYRRVDANDVRAMIGVLQGNVSKGIITTTSCFAPGIETDDTIRRFLPHRLELRPFDKLLPWLVSLSKGNPSPDYPPPWRLVPPAPYPGTAHER